MENVIIARPAEYAAKKARFIEGGRKKLQVVADFDYTLTRFWMKNDGGNDGEKLRASSCHAVIENCDLLPEEYHTTAQKLQAHYYPLEVDPSIALTDKIKYMEEWVTKAHDALIKYNFRQLLLEQAVKHSNLRLRDGLQGVFDLIHNAEVPMLIFSAGIADVIEEVLRQQAKPPAETHIVSNKMIFNEEGRLIGFTHPVFHVLNKRASSVLNTSPYFHETDYEARTNILLLGDNVGDTNMTDGLKDAAHHEIKIGFLNDRVESRLDEYQEKFDVVILGDGNLNFVDALLRELLAS